MKTSLQKLTAFHFDIVKVLIQSGKVEFSGIAKHLDRLRAVSLVTNLEKFPAEYIKSLQRKDFKKRRRLRR